MRELIEQLENATGPSDKLDLAIAEACGIKWSSDEDGNYGPYGILPRRVRFTASLDAAMALVPPPKVASDGGRKVDITWDEKRGRSFALVNWDYNAQGATPAIALCIAALKARTLTPVSAARLA